MTYLNGASIIAVGVLFPVLGTLAVALRFFARRKRGIGIKTDDWLCLPALALDIAIGGIFIYGSVKKGVGYHSAHIDKTSPEQMVNRFQETQSLVERLETYVWIMAVPAIGFIKLSVLFFYRRIFRGKLFNILSWVMIALVTAWTIAFFLNNAFACGVHLEYRWGSLMEMGTKCDQTTVSNAGNSVSDFIMDVIILVMPLGWIWRLQMPTRQKLSVSGVMLLGALASAAAAYRMIVQMRILTFVSSYNVVQNVFGIPSTDTIGIITVLMFWTYVEIGVAMVACCLPSLKSLFEDSFHSVHSAGKTIKSRLTTRHTGSEHSSASRENMVRLGSQETMQRRMFYSSNNVGGPNGSFVRGSSEAHLTRPDPSHYHAGATRESIPFEDFYRQRQRQKMRSGDVGVRSDVYVYNETV